jgi:hypothetical protein
VSPLHILLVAALLVKLSTLRSAEAADVHGSVQVSASSTDQNGDPFFQLDQRYRLDVRQEITPFLSLVFDYRYNGLDSRSDTLDFGRSNQGPLFALVYQRPGMSGRVSYEGRRSRGTIESDNFDLKSLLATFRWRPRAGPSFGLNYRDEKNVADVAIFGRDVHSRALELSADYSQRLWYGRYIYRSADVDNPSVGYRLDEDRHDVIAGYHQNFWNRLSVTADTRLSRRYQNEVFSDDATPGTPVIPIPVRQGLFAVDTTPEIGELDIAPGLNDGDTITPVEPPIDIGGANTFRNIGVDLGLIRQISLLEITVDSLSGPEVIWEVYQSPDNLTWTRVSGVTAAFDSGFLRYNVRFPITTDRFFKAVNITVNSFSTVRVTEIRALVDAGDLDRGKSEATTFRADFSANVVPQERIDATVRFGMSNEDALARGLLSRDLEEMHGSAIIRVAATSGLDVIARYFFSNVDDPLSSVLQRDVKEWSGAVEYAPVPSVDGIVTFTRRDELDQGRLIQTADIIRGRFLTELLPSLSLISELVRTVLEEPDFGYTSWTWRETLESRLTERFQLGGTLSLARYNSTGVLLLTKRTRVELRAIWSVTPYLAFTGEWIYAKDDNQKTLMPRFNVAWTPGPKLRVSASYLETDTLDLRRTTTLGANADYRINPRLTPFIIFSRSSFDQVAAERSVVTTLRFGFNFFF